MVDATLGTGVSTQVGLDLIPWHVVDAVLGPGVSTQVGWDLTQCPYRGYMHMWVRQVLCKH